jgi:hypothetical protein
MMRNATLFLCGGLLLAAAHLTGCHRKATPPAAPPAAPVAPAAGAPGAPADAPAPHLGGAGPGKAQTRVREVMDRVRAETQLRTIGQFLGIYKTELNRYPNTLQELLDYIKTDARQEHESLQTGYFVFAPSQNPTSQTIVIYEKDPDTNGMRVVLMGDGSVQRLSEEQFKAAMPKTDK